MPRPSPSSKNGAPQRLHCKIKIGSRVLTLQPLNDDPGNDVMTLRTRQGLVSITGLRPRQKQDAKKVDVIFPKDFSPETLMGKKPND